MRERVLLLSVIVVSACGGEPATPPAAAGGSGPAVSSGPTAEPVAAAATVATADPALGDWGRAPRVPDPTATTVGAFFSAAGAPAPTACVVDADCHGDTLPAPGGCCNDPTSMGAYAAAYRSWLGTWRSAHCGGVTCPPPPAPVPPDACYFAVRCLDGACANSCAP